MKILITGGAGFIGQHLAHLLREDHELTALDLLQPQVHIDPEASRLQHGLAGDSHRHPALVRGSEQSLALEIARAVGRDVGSADAWSSLEPHDVVVHLAAETGTGQSMYQQDQYQRVNVQGTHLAAQAAARWASPLVAMSSRAVYGNGRHECVAHGTSFGQACCEAASPAPSQESDPHRPVSFYGTTKSLAEDHVAAVAVAVPATVIRPQNVVGPGQALHNPYTGVLAAFLARLREELPLQVYGDGLATRDFVHVHDVARLIAWSIDHPAPVGRPRTLNSGTGQRTTLRELAEAAIAGSPLSDVRIETVPVHRAGDIEHACADLSRLRSQGAPLPRWSSYDAITDFIRGSWDAPGATSDTWDRALDELESRGLTS